MKRSKRQSWTSAMEGPNPNVFDDEYAVDTADMESEYGVADTPTLPTTVANQIQSPAAKEAREGVEAVCTRRSSIAKETRTSFDIALPSTAGDPSTSQHYRPVSAASSFATVDDSRASYRRPSGPSHPYDLFPQAGVPGQSLISNSTPSRLRPSSYTPTQPAHPYALYQQNSFPVDDAEIDRVSAIPVGFPGRSANFERQIGPDGEDQGIVGPDSHTEDLPPYSKYPDSRTVKPILSATAPISPVDATSIGSRAIPRSQDELVSPIRPEDNPPSLPHHPLPPPESGATPSQSSIQNPQSMSPRSSGYSIKDEKAWRDKTWREKRRTRVCGGRLPAWVLFVAISILLFIIILVGGVIGGLLAVGKSREEPRTVTVTSTQSMVDASFIAAPTGLPQLTAGQYSFPLGIPQEKQTACLTSGDQYSAWSCNVPPMSLWGDIAAPSSGNSYNVLKLYPALPPLVDGSPPRFNFSYGAQPPKVSPMQRVFWVQDLAEPGRGPALHFQTTYDKLVILEESQFGQGSRKRNVPQYGSGSPTDYTPLGEHRPGESPPPSQPHGSGYRRKMMLQTGDSPWYCYWNQTFIEGFIYVSQNSSTNGGRSDAGSSAATTSVTTSVGGSMPTFSLSTSSAAPTVTPTTVTSHQARAAFAELEAHFKRVAPPLPTTASKDYNVPKSPGPPPKFPFVFKLTERRTPGSSQQAGIAPYCQKMFVPAEGAPYPVHDDDGRPTVVHLNENDPSPQDYSSALRKPEKTGAAANPPGAHKRSASSPRKREDPPKSCHCLWVSPVGP